VYHQLVLLRWGSCSNYSVVGVQGLSKGQVDSFDQHAIYIVIYSDAASSHIMIYNDDASSHCLNYTSWIIVEIIFNYFIFKYGWMALLQLYTLWKPRCRFGLMAFMVLLLYLILGLNNTSIN